MVFRLPSLPVSLNSVIERAKELVEELVSADITATVKNIASENKKQKTKPARSF